ncbi:TonB-dependent receptor [Sphingomonas sp. NFR15]|uniref:TonB-dependent receptor n=1 Tax=Sphingomonas sp. NFR15 TaxID=1566282 RepID=UPI00088767E4|nr:TonB-dependent receptor [Sphingomonas sp. NFR15]SDA15416.1 TonB-dependent receptor [Sphingomonas sp. NFR15]
MRSFTFLASTALASLVAVPAFAQQPAAASDDAAVERAEQDIVVTGVRASLQSAANVKRNAGTIVDSIVAEDIGKLPDNNATEALQRITGVQVSRDLGEGGSIAIRGLPQVETTLNGRETFTAGGGRTFNLQDFPAELVARIDVYKASTADLIEGGLGGLVDLRTRRPLDLPGFTLGASLRGMYSDSVKKATPSGSVFASDKWDTGIGEVGLLGSFSYQDRKYRQDIDSTGAPTPRSDLVPGQSVFAPNGNNQVLVIGERQRIGGNVALQWRPSPDLEFTLEGQYQRFKTTQQQYNMLVATAGSTPVAGSTTLFSGTQDVSQVSYANQRLTAGGTARDTLDENKSISLAAKWNVKGVTVNGDLTYTKSRNDLYYTELDLITTAPGFTQNLGTNPPSSSTGSYNLANLANYRVGGLTRNENHYVGDEVAARVDLEYAFEDSSFLKSIQGGFRFSDRSIAQQNPLRYTGQTASTDPASYSGLFQANSYGDFYTANGAKVDFQRNFPYANVSRLRSDFSGVLSQLGLTGALAPSTTSVNSLLAAFNADEKTTAGYVMAKFDFVAGLPIDGNIGVRYVQTDDLITGNQRRTALVNGVFVPVTPTIIDPVSIKNSYGNWLPSVNARVHLTHNLQLRLAASETLTRPDFSQLSPALTVVPGQLAASQGNPNLQPITSKNADVSLEWYVNKSTSLYVAGFYKRVKGFIFTRSTPGVTIGGVDGYTLSQPLNSGTGTVKGAEVGYQQFFDFLPGALSGLGIQANGTYTESAAPTSLVGFTAPLPQLSKYSYNIAGIYEKYGISARVAYNYRSSFLSSILAGAYTPPGGTTTSYVFPVMTKGYGWLDASLSYDIGKHVTLTIDGQNLLRTQIQQYYQVATRPGQYTIDDRQFMAGVRVKF